MAASIVCVHGLGGTGATMEPLAAILRAAGHDVATPTLPGHGTEPSDLVGITWRDWLDAIPRAPVVIGQSMGGSLALAAAASRPDVRAVVCINALAPDPDAVDGLEWSRAHGRAWVDAPPAASGEKTYDRLSIESLLAMATGVAAIDLALVLVPVLVVEGALDDVVDPANSDRIAATVTGEVERIILQRSGHAAALGPELDDLARQILTWLAARPVSHGPAHP